MDNEICGFCAGKPRTLASSHSGTITLAVSLQEPVVFLAGTPPVSPSSYREHDNREAASYTQQQNQQNQQNQQDSDQDQQLEGPENLLHRQATNDDVTGTSPPPPPQQVCGGAASASASRSEMAPSILRGSILLKLTKPTKLKSLSLSFYGKCKTSWNQNPTNPYDDSISAHPMAEIQDELIINAHNWEFIPNECKPDDLQCHTISSSSGDQSASYVYSDLYGADAIKIKGDDHVQTKDPAKSEAVHNSNTKVVASQCADSRQEEIPLFVSQPSSNRKKTLSNTANSLFHTKDSAVQFPAGEYVYHFTLAIDSKVPESINASKGSLTYYLVPKVVRSGTFALNLSGYQEVELVRSPPNNYDSVSNNPIAISRNWDERLHYEILIPKKHISLGSSIPMAIKLTPLEKVMVHRVRVHVVETVQYTYSHDSSMNYTDRSLKILLYEKKAKTEPVKTKELQQSQADHQNNNSSHGGLLQHFPLTKIRSNDHKSHSDSDGKNSSSSKNKKNKKGREKLTGNLLHYTLQADDSSGFENGMVQPQQLEPHAAHGAPLTNGLPQLQQVASNRSMESPEEAAATTIDCTLPLLSDPTWSASSNRSVDYLNKPTTSETYVKNLHPDSFHCPFIRIRHRLTISFRISKQDPEDPKRRHFEVKIDTPIHFLSKHCVNENVDLPEYDQLYNNIEGGVGVPLTYINSNDSNYPMSTVAVPAGEQLPSFDELVLGESDSENDGVVSNNGRVGLPPPPDYDTAVGL